MTIQVIVTKFRTKFSLLELESPTRLHRERTEEYIAAISASINDDHHLSRRLPLSRFLAKTLRVNKPLMKKFLKKICRSVSTLNCNPTAHYKIKAHNMSGVRS